MMKKTLLELGIATVTMTAFLGGLWLEIMTVYG